MKILVAEDDRDMVKSVAELLSRKNYTVDCVSNGDDAYEYLLHGDYDGAVIDIMMPGLSGLEVVRHLREQGNSMPVLMLTALAEVDDRIAGLDAGADDYLPKPFDSGELLARVRAMLRRNETYTPDIIRAGDLCLDRGSYQLSCGDRAVSLNNKSFQVMEMFMVNFGRVLSSNYIMEHIWGWDSEAEINVVWVNISSLRKHMEKIGSRMQLRAIRGAGYRLEETDA